MISVSSLLCLTIALLMIIACETHRAFNVSCRLYFEQRRSRPISSWISDSSWSLIRSREFYITSCRSWRHAAIELRMWLCIRIWHCSALHVSGELLEDPSLARANHVYRRSQISEVHAWAIVQRLQPDVTQSVSSDRQAHVALRAQCAAQRGDSASLQACTRHLRGRPHLPSDVYSSEIAPMPRRTGKHATHGFVTLLVCFVVQILVLGLPARLYLAIWLRTWTVLLHCCVVSHVVQDAGLMVFLLISYVFYARSSLRTSWETSC